MGIIIIKYMKKIKTKIILFAVVFFLTIGAFRISYASGSSLYVVPENSSQISGSSFNISAAVNASGNKICAVEGTLVLNNLSCQNITLANGVIPQSAPTCSKPYFLIGIPGCTTANQTLFTVSVKAGSAGSASVSFTGVDLIGTGTSVGSSSVGGNYIINTATKQSIQAASSYSRSTSTKTISKENYQLIKEVKTPITTPTIAKPDAFLASISEIITLGTENNIVGIIVVFAIPLGIYLLPSYFEKRKKTTK